MSGFVTIAAENFAAIKNRNQTIKSQLIPLHVYFQLFVLHL